MASHLFDRRKGGVVEVVPADHIKLRSRLDLLQKSLTPHPQPLPACGYGVHTVASQRLDPP
ncbi:hypothetical protein [Nostoc sp. PCC 9305]|uniref:hypothetical protein n=1 Tax=Nostoc sp. PCC 9305 TaxID=296636 RepID=UPI0039C5E1BE